MNKIKFRLKTEGTKKDLEDLLNDLEYFGVLHREIIEETDGFYVTLDRKEWEDSWKGVGFSGTNYAQMFQEELDGQDFKATVTEEQP